MSKTIFRDLQQKMQNAGYYKLKVDGIWGDGSQKAFDAMVSDVTNGGGMSDVVYDIAWSKKVSPVFVDRVKWIADELKLPEDGASHLMGCMAWESGETFSASQYNYAGSGAVGLIQFMPSTALAFFYSDKQIEAMSATDKKIKGKESCARLAAMTAEDQLNYVYKYFKPYTGRLKNIGDLYMAILWPKGIGKSDEWVLWAKGEMPKTFAQNAGLDLNKDEAITRAECIKCVVDKLHKGLKPENRRVLA